MHIWESLAIAMSIYTFHQMIRIFAVQKKANVSISSEDFFKPVMPVCVCSFG